ncbi:uncharacterized protein A1O9_12366 [Exophiala aquamarina CBS 119918]|uniref:Major facilitator superfamily (MFS) profile domain-containing protein n=1 Tax=Exophiala aquamarina CBS 119918 TaxID=1182545 RepID=A0A072NUA5_9EURO|nr:uncharacterized protein A1O9_12366 [Exophiala aquamarina CBS 119918]KEF51449.1 hypothetical protein A1O9_12366 [Exophiala aquamarina CBS 119918]
MSKRNLWFAAAVALQTGATFGYSVGFVGGVLVLPSFLRHFHLATAPAHELARAQSAVVSSWIVGAFFGVPAGIPICSRYGRKPCLMFCAALYLLGTILQVINAGWSSIGIFELGRLMSGFGVGAGTLVSPIYISEISSPADRGILMSGYQVVIQGTALVGFWAAYAANAAIAGSLDLQWQIPVAIQLIPGSVLLFGAFFIPESPHYVAGTDTVFAVEQSLAWFRGRSFDDPLIAREARNIYDAGLSAKRRQALQPASFTHAALTNPIRRRLLVGIGLFITQNATGMNALNYFAPVVFLSITKSVSGALFLTGIFGAVKLLSAFSYMFYCVRVRGNRFWLLGGTAICALCMFVLAYCARPEDPASTGPDHASIKDVLAVASMYLFAYSFGLSSGPIAWNVCSEIFPSHLNAKCCAITTSTQWACQIVIAAITPLLLASIGTQTFTVYGACTMLGLIFCWAFVPETRGVALGREMSLAFGQDVKDDDPADVEEVEDIFDEVTPLLRDQKRRRRSSVAIVV